MKSILSISLIFFILTLSATAQENVLEVLSVKGKVLWKNSGAATLLDLHAYQRLLPSDQIILRDSTSKVRFVNNKTKYVAELRKPGKYLVSSVLQDPSWQNELQNFIDLILEEVKPASGGSQFIVGGSIRALKDSLYPPDQTVIIQDEITFKWNSKNEPRQKFFIEKDSKFLIELVLTDASLTLSTKSEILNIPGKYTWKGYNNGTDSNPNCFSILSYDEKENLKKAIAVKKSERTGNEIFDLLELAKFYKQHNLFLEADVTYEQIVKLIQ